MMKARWFTVLTLGLLAAPLASCGSEPRGEIILAVQTDMSLPKDVSRIRIVVSYADTGGILFDNSYDRIAEPGNAESIRLPATLNLISPRESSRALRIRVLASQGTDDSGIRAIREIVTTFPTGRTVTLPVSIEFLCEGTTKPKLNENGKIVRDDKGNVILESTCGKGFTCKSGRCAAEDLPSEDLPTYDEGGVFGGGTSEGGGKCFDTTKCFEGAKDLEVDLEAFKADPDVCRTKPVSAEPLNVGLKTPGSGMCNGSGCFVALNADSDGGFRAQADGTIVLTPAVCDKIVSKQIAGVAAVPVGEAPCAQKRESTPTCGPWSSVESPLYSPEVVAVASGQSNPFALALGGGWLYWTSQGIYDTKNGKYTGGLVQRVPKIGGAPTVVAKAQGVPQGLVIDVGREFALWTDAIDTTTGSIGWVYLDSPVPSPTTLKEKLGGPTLIAVYDKYIYYADRGDTKVKGIETDATDVVLEDTHKNPMELQSAELMGAPPVASMAGAADGVCWTHAALNETNGAVVCHVSGATKVVAQNQATPRSLVLQLGADRSLRAVAWANFKTDGQIQRATYDRDSNAFDKAVAIPVISPAGLAIDGEGDVFYTSRGSGGIWRWKPGSKPEPLVEGRKNPEAVAVDDQYVYWTEKGPSGAADQWMIMKAKKP